MNLLCAIVTFSNTTCNIFYSLSLPDLFTYLYIISSLSRYVIFVTMYLYVYCMLYFIYVHVYVLLLFEFIPPGLNVKQGNPI